MSDVFHPTLANSLAHKGWQSSNVDAFVDPSRRTNFMSIGRNFYAKSIEADKSSFIPHYLLSHSYLYNHEYRRALESIDEARKLAPTYWANIYFAGLINESLDRYGEAYSLFFEFLKSSRNLVSRSSVYIYHLLVFFHHTKNETLKQWMSDVYDEMNYTKGFRSLGRPATPSVLAETRSIKVWLKGGPGDQARALGQFDEMTPAHVSFDILCDPRLRELFEAALRRPFSFIKDQNDISSNEYVLYQYQAQNAVLSNWPRLNNNISRAGFHDAVTMRPRGSFIRRRVGVAWRTFKMTERRMAAGVDSQSLGRFAPFVDECYVLQSDATEGELRHLREAFGEKLRFPDFDSFNDLGALVNLMSTCDYLITIGNSLRDLSTLAGVPVLSISFMPGLLDAWRETEDQTDIFQRNVRHYSVKKYRSRFNALTALTQDISDLF